MRAFADFIREGGPFMYVNLCTSVLALGIIIDRAIFFLRHSYVNTPALLEQIRKLVSANNVDRAVKLCSATSAPPARVARAGLVRIRKGEAAIAMAIEETLLDVTPQLKKRISALWALANIATLLGLIGTIFGLIKTFGSLGAANPADRARMLSDGIAEAMNNTALGLSIAVTCMVGHLLLSGISKKQQSSLEGFALKLENFLTEGTVQRAEQAAGEPRR